MKFQLVKTQLGWKPATDEDKAKMDKISHGDVILCKSLDQRNAKFHRKFFALVALAFENLPHEIESHFPTQDDLRYELIKRAGFYQAYTDFKGNTQYRAESISFDSMGQERFEELYSKVLDVIVQKIIPGLDKEELLNELLEFSY